MQRANSSAQEAPEAEGHIPSSPGKVAPNLFLYFWWRAGAVDQSKLFPMYFWGNFGFTFGSQEEEQVLLTNPSCGPEHLFDRSARSLQFYNWLLSNAQNLIALLYLLYLNGGTAVMFQYIFSSIQLLCQCTLPEIDVPQLILPFDIWENILGRKGSTFYIWWKYKHVKTLKCKTQRSISKWNLYQLWRQTAVEALDWLGSPGARQPKKCCQININ